MKIEDVTPEHFNKSPKKDDVSVELWNDDVLLSSDVYFYAENQDITPFMEEIKRRLIRFNQDKQLVLQNIIDEGYLQIAEAWAEDSNISLPISKEQFLESFYPFEIGLCIGNIEDEPTVMVYLGCNDEYFSDHVLCCYIRSKDNQTEYKTVLEG